jgi:hypothetical protein
VTAIVQSVSIPVIDSETIVSIHNHTMHQNIRSMAERSVNRVYGVFRHESLPLAHCDESVIVFIVYNRLISPREWNYFHSTILLQENIFVW